MTKAIAIALVAATAGLANPAQAAEILNVTFTTPTGGVTSGLYSGTVKVKVQGTGQSLGAQFNDAFYLLPDATHDSLYYQLTFGTSPLVAYNPSQNATNFIVGSLPAFNALNTYEFLLNTQSITPTQLYFGVGDGVFSDNSGAYQVTIESAVPEPATWALMLIGFGAVGFSLRRRKTTISVRYA